jgi:hypothetical protein
MARIILKGDEINIAAGVGNSSTVSNASLVRVLNPAGTATTVFVTDPTGVNAYSGIGSFTLQGNAVEYVEKQPTYTIYGETVIKAVRVGFAAN